MTREQFIEKYRHEFGGLVADAFSTDAKGGELSMRMRANFRKIDQLLAQAFYELTAKEKVPENGVKKT